MKRSTPNLRSTTEVKKATTDKYAEYLKWPGQVNPIFTRKPYESVKK